RLALRLSAAAGGSAAAAHDALVELLDALHQLVDLLLGLLAETGVVAAQLVPVGGHLLEAPAELLRLGVALADRVMESADLQRLLGHHLLGLGFLLFIEPLELLQLQDLRKIRRGHFASSSLL